MTHEQAEEAATGAGGVISLGGQTWVVAQPQPADFLLLRSWIKKRLPSPLQAVMAAVKGLPAEFQQAAIREAVSLQGSGSDLTPDRVQSELATPDGLAFWLWILCRKDQPDVTPATFRPHINDDNVYAILADLLAVSRMRDVDPNSPSPSGASTTARRDS